MKRGGKKPLEWVFSYINVTDDTITNKRIELGLKDDEVAEIHRIDSLLNHEDLDDAADASCTANMYLSMDPDAEASPALAATHDDLEVFFENQCDSEGRVGAAGTAFMNRRTTKQTEDFNPPVLVGTDIGHVMICESTSGTIAGQSWVRIYFTRRKATVMELNQILLKRR